MPFVERPAHRVRYAIHGAPEAPPLVLIMGLALGADAWDSLVPRLAARHRVIVVDNRGTGESTLGRAWFGMRELADDIAAVLDAAAIPSAAVFGISMGGMIALTLALDHPDRVDALVLGCTYAGFWRSRKAGLRTVVDLLVGNLVRSQAAARLTRTLVSEQYAMLDPGGVAAWLARGQPAPPWIAMLQMLAITRHSTAARLHQLRVPTLIISGDEDRLIPVENSYQLAQWIPGARLHILRGAGHCFPMERELETVAALDEFLPVNR